MSRFYFGRLNAVNANDVIAERSLYHRTDFARSQREHHRLELWNEPAAPTIPTEIASELLGAGVHRLALGDLLEVSALSDFGEQ